VPAVGDVERFRAIGARERVGVELSDEFDRGRRLMRRSLAAASETTAAPTSAAATSKNTVRRRAVEGALRPFECDVKNARSRRYGSGDAERGWRCGRVRDRGARDVHTTLASLFRRSRLPGLV
jgi:hypothetical protein